MLSIFVRGRPVVLAAVNAAAKPFRFDRMRTRLVDRSCGQDYS